MNYDNLVNKWYEEEKQAFSGWDFSYLKSRMSVEELPWDYRNIIKKYLNRDDILLDMGTGGGEFLLGLNHNPNLTSVTEAWEPNIKLCKNKLSPLGITVYPIVDDDQLPIEDNKFDIIINKQEAYSLSEVSRILKPNGIFITQQVGSENNSKLSQYFYPKRLVPNFSLNSELNKIVEHDFEILFADEAHVVSKFYDVGAIVFYVKRIPWEFPDFTVDAMKNKLIALQTRLESSSYITSDVHRFVFVLRNNNLV